MKSEERNSNEVNIVENELDKIDDKIYRIKSYQIYHILEIDRQKLKQKGTIISLVIADSTLPVIFASLGQITAAISVLIGATTYATTKYIIEFRKRKFAQKKSEEAQKQIDYLEEVKQKIQKEYKNKKTNNSSININYINKKYDWRNKISLMNIYDRNKKKFVKLYKKGELTETLKNEYPYTNEEISYLYERSKNEVKNKKKIKVK